MNGFYKKCKPVKNKKLYDQFYLDHPYCMACGVPGSKAANQVHCGGVGLSRHHICKFGRSDEVCNIIVLCYRDHCLAEGLLIRDMDKQARELFPKLTLAIMLTIKIERYPDQCDPVRLEELYGSRLPDPEPIPAFLVADWLRWKGDARIGQAIAF